MTKDQVQRIAEQFVADQSLSSCKVVSVYRSAGSAAGHTAAIGGEWMVQFVFDCDEDVSASYALVVVDDVTGKPQLIEGL